MNHKARIVPPDSPLGRPQKERRPLARMVVFIVLAAHFVLLVGLLIQGCKHSEPREDATSVNPTNALPSAVANPPVAVAPTPETNQPAWPAPPAAQSGPPVVMEPPAPPSATKPYAVVKGDSFYKIARVNGISMRALANANPGVDSAKLRVGQVLQLPQAAATTTSIAPAAAAPPTKAATANHNANTYVVKSGDTLAKIAKAHGTTVRAIRASNRLKSDQIVVGQKLELPDTRVATAAASRSSSSQP